MVNYPQMEPRDPLGAKWRCGASVRWTSIWLLQDLGDNFNLGESQQNRFGHLSQKPIEETKETNVDEGRKKVLFLV
jgi:hypothetical protein